MSNPRPTTVDLFAGAGGLSLGFEQAGFDTAAAIEIDPIHAAVHSFNFPLTTVIPSSVSKLGVDDLVAQARLSKRAVDVVFGGPPCQGFSMIGRRMLDDPRNRLVGDFVRVVTQLNASYFVFENVKGLTAGRHRRFLDELIREFDAAGYSVRLPWRVLNASDFGVPQSRERLFLIGARKGLVVPHYPRPTTSRDQGLLVDMVLPTPTCQDALEDLPNADEYEELLDGDVVRVGRVKAQSQYARQSRCDSSSAWRFGYRRSFSRLSLTSSARTRHSDISRSRFSRTAPGSVEPISRFFKLHPKGVSNTLRAGTDAARGAFTSPRPIHYQYPRCITVREMARLQGFPDWFRFHATKWHGARQVGNSVPPPLAYAVASEVAKAMGYSPAAPPNLLKLGDASLLTLDMARASAHWGVSKPSGKRDRRSGARKRRQVDIEREICRSQETDT